MHQPKPIYTSLNIVLIMEKKQARNRAWIGKGIFGLFLIAAFFSCGCISIEEGMYEVVHTPETFVASGFGNTYDFRNGYPNDNIIVSGQLNTVYIDFGDRVTMSGMGNEVIRT